MTVLVDVTVVTIIFNVPVDCTVSSSEVVEASRLDSSGDPVSVQTLSTPSPAADEGARVSTRVFTLVDVILVFLDTASSVPLVASVVGTVTLASVSVLESSVMSAVFDVGEAFRASLDVSWLFSTGVSPLVSSGGKGVVIAGSTFVSSKVPAPAMVPSSSSNEIGSPVV